VCVCVCVCVCLCVSLEATILKSPLYTEFCIVDALGH